MGTGTESVLFNAIPLLVLAAASLAVAVVLGPRLWRARRRVTAPEAGVVASFLCVGVAAALWGAIVLVDERPIGGNVWGSLVAILVVTVPAGIALASLRDPTALLSSTRMHEAEAAASARDREVRSVGKVAAALARAGDESEIARVLVTEVRALLGIEVAGMALLDEDGRTARGTLLRGPDGELEWFVGLEFDLVDEASGVASAATGGAPVIVVDVEHSNDARQTLAQRVDAKSAVFVPLVAGERVLAVLIAASSAAQRFFSPPELRALRALSGEAAQALERARATAALAEALTRERLLANIARRIRSELELASVTRVAVAETAAALRLHRAFIRLGDHPSRSAVEAEWAAPGVRPLPQGAAALPVSNLALRERRTVAVADVRAAPELADPSLGGLGLLEELGVRAVLAVPIVALDRTLGVFGLHASSQRAWSEGEVALAESVAREVALAIETARILDENRARLARQAALVAAAAVVAHELEPQTVLQRLVEEVTFLLDADAADCYLLDREAGVLRLAASHGLDPSQVAAEFPADRGLAGRALAEARPVLSNDYRALDRPLDGDAYGEFEYAIAAPMSWSGDVRGTLSVASKGGRAFVEADLGVLEAFAHLASLALRNAQLLLDNTQRIERQKVLLRAAQVMTSELDPETVLQRVVEQVTTLVGGEGAVCYLHDAGRARMRVAALQGLPAELEGVEAATGEPLPHAGRWAHELSAPLAWSGQSRALVAVGRREGSSHFEQPDQEALDTYATLASLALRNAQAFEERERQARVERGFFRIAAVLGETLSLPETLAAVAQAASESLGGDFAAVLMPGDGLDLAASHDLPAPLLAALAGGLPESAAVLAGAARERRILAAPDVSVDERFGDGWRALADQAGFAALLAIPIAAADAERGGLVVVFVAAPRAFVDDDLELARQLASAARGALERSELFERERAARALAQQLARTGSVLAAELEPAAVLDEVVLQAVPLLRVDACSVRVLEGEELVLHAAAGEGIDVEFVGSRVPSTARLTGDVLQTRAPVAIQDVGDDPRLLEGDPLLGEGYRAYLGVPLSVGEAGPHGVLAVYSQRARAWRQEEVEALGALAANAAAAVSTAELYQRVALEKQQSDAILANIADGIVAVDRDGRVVLWNAAAERITGVPAEDALGRPPAQALQRELEGTPGPAGERLASIQRGAEEVWLSLSEAVMRDPVGAVAGRIFAFRDISAERVLEQMKSDFVSTVSAQLRTPLTSIYGFAETLLRQDVLFGEDERRTFLGYIASESERLTTIVDALLNVARLDTGDLHVQLAPTDVRPVVEEVVAGAQAAAAGNGHSFVVDAPGEPVDAQADRDKLRQILQNLVENAVKYSPDGGTVTIGVHQKGETVELRVTDEGIGIPSSVQHRIFDKFVRADPTGRDGGTGLGLFIAQGLVTAMGGRIWVDSEEGKGASFAVELPAAPRGPAKSGFPTIGVANEWRT